MSRVPDFANRGKCLNSAQLAADLNPLDSKKRKRPNQTPQSGSSVSNRKDLKDYTVVMVEDTKAVTANKYEKPNTNKLGALNAKGYVQVVSLHGQNTGEEITGAVSTAFMATVPDVDTYGFRILESSFLLKHISLALDIAVWKRAQSQTTVRDAGPGYKNTIFVALSSEAPNLPLPGVANPKPARSTDGGSDGEESSGKKPHNENDSENITQPKDSATKSPAESDGETASNTSNDGPPRKKKRPVTPDFGQEYPEFSMNKQDETAFDFEDTDYVQPIPTSHLKFVRLIKHITKPDVPAQWEFDRVFGVGPGGISIILPAFDLVYSGLERIRFRDSELNAASIKTRLELEGRSDGLLACLFLFRTTHNRSLWDPKGGFRELATVLHKADQSLRVVDEKHAMLKRLNLIDLELDSESSLRLCLAEAFGSANDPRQMNHEVVVGGKYGLPQFYATVVEPLLDSLSLDRPDYDAIYALVNDCCRALGRKCVNHLKTKDDRGPKANQPNTEPNPDSETPRPRTRAKAGSASIPRNAKYEH
ncbi:hypothetical protein K438DRAFT_1975733 [Mycena galopus ATCC 62051]|nr:hypothetical protein K438DRAFT_1975733 [Mycena galopus ATCC 62051]